MPIGSLYRKYENFLGLGGDRPDHALHRRRVAVDRAKIGEQQNFHAHNAIIITLHRSGGRSVHPIWIGAYPELEPAMPLEIVVGTQWGDKGKLSSRCCLESQDSTCILTR